jgi:hypothetical protein
MSISVGLNRPITCTGFRPGRTENLAGRPIRRLGIRAVLPAKRPKATPSNDRNGTVSKLRVCIAPAVDTMTAVSVDTMTPAAVDTMTAVAIDTMTAMAVDTTTTTATAVIDTTIASGGRNSLSTTDAFDTEPY